jgi:mono/diheme cytochrome c family protein
VDDAYLFVAIVRGRPGTAMPSWKHLSAEDVADLIRHLRGFNAFERRELAPYRAHGDATQGHLLYQGMCASCHGAWAEGGIGPQLSNRVFLESASDALLREWIRYGKHDTQMRAFGADQQGLAELSDAQIEDVVTFLRRFEFEPALVTSRPGMGIIPRGAEVYAQACAACHGRNGEGATGSALANRDFLAAASDGYLQATIVLGRDGTEMRAMGKGGQGNVELAVEDVENLVAFLRSWERTGDTTISHRFVLGADLVNGRLLYESHCSGCHGTAGKGTWAPSLNNPEFLAAATDGFLQATIARGRAGTPMRPFGRGAGGLAELSGEEIDDIVAYVRSMQSTAPAAAAAGAANH